MNHSDPEDMEDPVQLVREPVASRHRGLLPPSGKRPQRRGIPIDVPSNQPRKSSFSVEVPNTALLTGYRDSGFSRRKSSGSLQGVVSSFSGHGSRSGTGQVPGAARPLRDKTKTKLPEVVLLSDEDEQRDQRNIKRKKIVQSSTTSHPPAKSLGPQMSMVAKMKRHPTSLEITSKSMSIPLFKPATTPATDSKLLSSSPPKHEKIVKQMAQAKIHPHSRPPQSIPTHAPLSDKASALGTGSFPQAILAFVRLKNEIDYTSEGMVIQFGSDRLTITIDKSHTLIPHIDLKSVERFPLNGRIDEAADSPPPLDSEGYDSMTEVNQFQPETSSNFRHFTSSAKDEDKVLPSKSSSTKSSSTKSSPTKTSPTKTSPARTPPSETSVTLSKINHGDETNILFVFPLKSSIKSKSIEVLQDDMSRLNDGEYLNDTLIEFGLKHIYANKLLTKSGSESNEDFASKPDASATRISDILSRRSIFSSETIAPQGHSTGTSPDNWTPPKKTLRSSTSSSAATIDPEEKPYIIVLDSLGGLHPPVFRSLRLYLQHELLARKNIDISIGSKDVIGKIAKNKRESGPAQGKMKFNAAVAFAALAVILSVSALPTEKIEPVAERNVVSGRQDSGAVLADAASGKLALGMVALLSAAIQAAA
ncbi:hypothetical protein BGZ76_006416 [Entomortierella beljakovae]|nr:hypothetical protein BGZ76_006416 [Entomortierella beljakovae]